MQALETLPKTIPIKMRPLLVSILKTALFCNRAEKGHHISVAALFRVDMNL